METLPMTDQTARRFASPFPNAEPAAATGPVLAPVLDSHGRIPDPIDARLADLARRAQQGDAFARNGLFLALWPRCAPMLYAIRAQDRWRLREGRAWTFDDVEQEAFPIFCDLVERWRSDQPRFAGYFFTRFHWRLTDLLWRWSRPARAELPLSFALHVAGDDDQTAELRSLIDSQFQSLSARDRQVLEWRIVDGHTDAEIADACGVCLKTVRRWRTGAFARAQAVLRNERTVEQPS
jgi:DNA-directed RNA polymerase specialized sigma24 family protein